MEKPNYFGILPATVRYSKEVSAFAKILFAEVTALSNKNGFCNARNSKFAELFDVSETTISKTLTSLDKAGFLKVDIERNSSGTFRKIFPLVDTYGRKVQGGLKKSSRGVEEKFKGGLKKTARQKNNTSNNITSNNINNSAKANDTISEIDFLKKELAEANKKLEKEKEKSSAKKEKGNHVFPDITPQKQYKVTTFNPCLTSASGGKEINKKWKTIEDLKEEYQSSRGIKVDTNIVEAAKRSFIESGFNYHKNINTLYKLEDALFRWIDKQKKGLNESNNNNHGKQSTDNGKSIYENYADILYGRSSEDDNDVIDIGWAEA